MRLKIREIGYFLLFWGWLLHLCNSRNKTVRCYITPSIRYKENKILREIWSNLAILILRFVIISPVLSLKFRFSQVTIRYNVIDCMIIYIRLPQTKKILYFTGHRSKSFYYMPRINPPNFNSFGLDLEVAPIDFWVKKRLKFF